MIVTIKDGSVGVEIEGVKGTHCLQLTQAIEALIGTVDTKNYKKEFYSNIENKQDVNLNLWTKDKSIDKGRFDFSK